MRKLLLAVPMIIFTISCNTDQGKYKSLLSEKENLEKTIQEMDGLIQQLRDSIKILSYPAEQRLNKVNSLVAAGSYSEAKQELNELRRVFPNSKEASSSATLYSKIDKLIEQKRVEEERVKALGFKAIKSVSSVVIGYNKVDFSNISIGNTFIFDSYGDRYFYRTADRGNKYITASMNVTSESKDPKLPIPALYSIEGDRMIMKRSFDIEFARWKDYGTYLGNSSDFGNDFAKTSTVRFKIGLETSEETFKKPYAVIIKKENVLERKYERFDNPPISYQGSTSYPLTLHLEDFTGDNPGYVILKIANL